MKKCSSEINQFELADPVFEIPSHTLRQRLCKGIRSTYMTIWVRHLPLLLLCPGVVFKYQGTMFYRTFVAIADFKFNSG